TRGRAVRCGRLVRASIHGAAGSLLRRASSLLVAAWPCLRRAAASIPHAHNDLPQRSGPITTMAITTARSTNSTITADHEKRGGFGLKLPVGRYRSPCIVMAVANFGTSPGTAHGLPLV